MAVTIHQKWHQIIIKVASAAHHQSEMPTVVELFLQALVRALKFRDCQAQLEM
jgi:hypothetical protein